MRRLVGDLVDVASIEAGMLAVTQSAGHPAEVVTEAVETFQAQASASGVSLSAEIVPGVTSFIVQGHGGRIWGENRRCGGSIFSFSLPVDAER
jgi:signal transduction histidine kinase